jgi:anti-sigma factor RsiW
MSLDHSLPRCVGKQQLFAYATGMLDADEERRVKAHLSTCPGCRETVQSYFGLEALLDVWKAPEPSPWFDARLRSALKDGQAPRSSWKPLGLRWVSGFLSDSAHWLIPTLTMAVLILTATTLVRVHRSDRGVQSANHSAEMNAQNEASADMLDEGGSQHSVRPAAPRTDEGPTAQDDEMLANFDVLSELPIPRKQNDPADN